MRYKTSKGLFLLLSLAKEIIAKLLAPLEKKWGKKDELCCLVRL